MFIAQNITFLLQKFKLTLTQLSKKTGINRTKLIRIQNGQNLRFRLNDIIILCNYFNVSIEDFIMTDINNGYTPCTKKVKTNDFDYINQFSKNFIYLTNRDDVSLYQLEKQLPISRMTLNRLYRNTKGNYELATVLKICEHYHLSIDDILKKDLAKVKKLK